MVVGFVVLFLVELLLYVFYLILVGVCGIVFILIGFLRFLKVVEKKEYYKIV